MRKSMVYIVALLLYDITAFAQYNIKENNVWVFGYNDVLNFNSGNPVFSSLSCETAAGCASVSDSNGNLLFYCNPDSVWDRMGNVMPNGKDLVRFKPNCVVEIETTQGSLIIPVVGSRRQYYVFSLETLAYTDTTDTIASRLFYSVVDMSLNAGLGDIMPSKKRIQFDSMLGEKMIAVAGNNCDVWLLLHERRNHRFKAYNINATGINTTPVISDVGNLPLQCIFSLSLGEMKISPDRSKLIFCNYYCSPYHLDKGIELYDFDASTGKVSNARTINDSVNGPYGACFSPDNSKVYVSCVPDTAWKIVQFDLGLPTDSAIRNSMKIVSSSSITGTDIKLGSDGKMYYLNLDYVFGSTHQIGKIDYPNLAGVACHDLPYFLNINPNATFFCFPNEYVKPLCDLSVDGIQRTENSVSVWPNPATSVLHVDAQSDVYVSILSVEGKVLLRDCFVPRNDASGINVEGLPGGTYFLEITNSSGERVIKKIVKE